MKTEYKHHMCTRSGGPVLFHSDLRSEKTVLVWLDLKDGMLTVKNGRSVTILQWDVANLRIAIIPELPFSFVVSNKVVDSLCFCTLTDTAQRNKWLNHFTRFEIPIVGANGRHLTKAKAHYEKDLKIPPQPLS